MYHSFSLLKKKKNKNLIIVVFSVYLHLEPSNGKPKERTKVHRKADLELHYFSLLKIMNLHGHSGLLYKLAFRPSNGEPKEKVKVQRKALIYKGKIISIKTVEEAMECTITCR